VDNVTHTLAGALVAQTIAELWPRAPDGIDPERRRRALIWILVAGNNLPDLDFVYTRVTGGKLGYLLHHRGHTHTLVGASIAAALLTLGTELWARRRAIGWSVADRRLLLACCALGPLLHIAMDFANDYGIHPFWPVYDGWFYGDSVFIVEPLLFAAAAPLVFLAKTRVWRAVTGVTLTAGLGLTWAVEFVPRASAIAVNALGFALLAVGLRARRRTAALSGVGAWLAVTLTFVLAGTAARQKLDVFVRANDRGRTTYDRVLTAMPANPLCWSVLLVQSEGGVYHARRGMLSIAPGLFDVGSCPRAPGEPTAPLVAAAAPAAPGLVWRGELALPIAELAALAKRHCEVAAFLRFARVPWFVSEPGRLVVGDLRYDREPELGFAELALELAPTRCPRFVPPWIPPRQDLLNALESSPGR